MNRRSLFAATILACVPALASAQVVAAPTIRAPQRANVDALRRAADQRWDAVAAADQAYMNALRSAVTAEIASRRAHGEDVAELSAEQARLQEMQMSFSMQYLTLQEQMQDENRQFTMISNIMKTRHDTARNSISNVR